MRPVDWYVLDLPGDPVPGDPGSVGVLARQVQRVAEDAERAEREVQGLAGDGAVTTWLGLAAEVFREALQDFPQQLRKLADSYDQAASALTGYAGSLDMAQEQADRALMQGRIAQAEIDSVGAALSSARRAASSAGSTADLLGRPPADGTLPPDPEQVRAAIRHAMATSERVSSLTSVLAGAQGRLETAKRMARDAQQLRDGAADSAANRLRDASEAGIAPNSFWQDFKSAAAQVWAVTVKVATVVAIVLAVIALFVGGPLVWGLLLAASAILLADSLAKYARGEGSLWMVGLNLLGVIPGGRLLTSLGKLAGLTRIGTRGLAAGSRGLAAARTSLTSMATGLRNGLGRTVLRLGDETGSASLDLLTLGLSRLGRTAPAKFGNLKPNHTYTHNGATYRTDELGRVTDVHVPRLARHAPVRDPYAQRMAGKAGQPGDQGGHLVGARFGGSDEGYNLVPQNANLNLGKWKAMENDWDRAVKAGQDVSVRIRPRYTNEEPRPTWFDVESKIDNVERSRRFHNAPGGVRP